MFAHSGHVRLNEPRISPTKISASSGKRPVEDVLARRVVLDQQWQPSPLELALVRRDPLGLIHGRQYTGSSGRRSGAQRATLDGEQAEEQQTGREGVPGGPRGQRARRPAWRRATRGRTPQRAPRRPRRAAHGRGRAPTGSACHPPGASPCRCRRARACRRAYSQSELKTKLMPHGPSTSRPAVTAPANPAMTISVVRSALAASARSPLVESAARWGRSVDWTAWKSCSGARETRNALNTAPAAAAPVPASAAMAGGPPGASRATAIVPAVIRSCSASITITVAPANTAPARSVRFSAPVAGSRLGLDHLEVGLAGRTVPLLRRALGGRRNAAAQCERHHAQ